MEIKLDYDKTNAANTDSPCFVNNTLHCLFSECGVTANGIKNYSANGHNAQKAFIKTEFLHNKEAEETWLRCQDFSYEKELTILLLVFSRNERRKQRNQTLYRSTEKLLRIFSQMINISSVASTIATQGSSRLLSDLR